MEGDRPVGIIVRVRCAQVLGPSPTRCHEEMAEPRVWSASHSHRYALAASLAPLRSLPFAGGVGRDGRAFDKCKPKKCRQECKKSCPVAKPGAPPTAAARRPQPTLLAPTGPHDGRRPRPPPTPPPPPAPNAAAPGAASKGRRHPRTPPGAPPPPPTASSSAATSDRLSQATPLPTSLSFYGQQELTFM
eukprot:XP_020407760.1 uncharacterized protein LOC109945814 [Zea mays]